MRENFVAEVERIAGRKVFGFLSPVHVDPDLAVETFILEPVERRALAAPAGYEPEVRPQL